LVHSSWENPVYTDGSKNEHGIGLGVGKDLQAQLKFKLDNICSNNKAEQLAITIALRVIDAKGITEN